VGNGAVVPDDAPPDDRHDDAPDDPEAPLYSSEPLETEEGEVVVEQQNLGGKDNIEGGGEWPDPKTPPRPPAPGSA
jgi:hypothetical protein